jgi:hypothetical protein
MELAGIRLGLFRDAADFAPIPTSGPPAYPPSPVPPSPERESASTVQQAA